MVAPTTLWSNAHNVHVVSAPEMRSPAALEVVAEHATQAPEVTE